MSQLVKLEDRQMALNFNVTPVGVKKSVEGSSKVVNLYSFARSRQLSAPTTPVIERLLKEAQNLRW